MIEQNLVPQVDQKMEQVPWTPRQTFLGVLLTLVPWVAYNLVVSSFNTGSTPTKPLTAQVDWFNAIAAIIFSLIIYATFLIAPFSFARGGAKQAQMPARSLLQLLGFRRFNFWRVIPLIILFILGIIAVNLVYSFIITTFNLPLQTNDQTILDNGKIAPISTYATLVVAVFVAPFCEEIFFRSFVFMGLLGDMSLGWALVLSALIFAAAHSDIASFPILFLIGLPLAFLRWRTRSIWPGMILHMLNNGLSAILIIQALGSK